MIKNIKKGSASYIILTVLDKTIDGYLRFDDLIHKPKYYAYGSGWDRPLKKSELSQAIRRLRDGGFIDQDKTDIGELIFKLTETGRFLITEPGLEKNWDGKWRIVAFDIPEQKRIIRNLFRRNLKRWGFKQLQKSVWISKRDVYQELTKYVQELGIEKWVTVAEADKLSGSIIT